jgi:hypothetical protein
MMKTLFDKETRDEIATRVGQFDGNAKRQWGRMNAYQMLKHCTLWEDMIFGKIPAKRAFIGRLFGRIALKTVLKDSSPLRRNTPTLPALIVKEESGDIPLQKKEWLDRIGAYSNFGLSGFMHPFFGEISREQIGQLAYKHADHHLRQFGA